MRSFPYWTLASRTLSHQSRSRGTSLVWNTTWARRSGEGMRTSWIGMEWNGLSEKRCGELVDTEQNLAVHLCGGLEQREGVPAGGFAVAPDPLKGVGVRER